VFDREQGQKITDAGFTFEVVDFGPHNVMNFRRRQCELFRHCIDVVIKILHLGSLQHVSLTLVADLHFQVIGRNPTFRLRSCLSAPTYIV
jgi:hypothetical protein